jgi:hypothetical protein
VPSEVGVAVIREAERYGGTFYFTKLKYIAIKYQDKVTASASLGQKG